MTRSCCNGRLDVVKFLIEHRAKLDLQTVCGYTALLLAIRYGHENIVALLLQEVANVDIRSYYRLSIISSHTVDYNDPIDNYHVHHDIPNMTALHIASLYSRVDMLNMLMVQILMQKITVE